MQYISITEGMRCVSVYKIPLIIVSMYNAIETTVIIVTTIAQIINVDLLLITTLQLKPPYNSVHNSTQPQTTDS